MESCYDAFVSHVVPDRPATRHLQPEWSTLGTIFLTTRFLVDST